MATDIMTQLRARIPVSAKTIQPVVSPWDLSTGSFGAKAKTKFTPPDDLLTLSVTHFRLRNATPFPFFEGGIIDPTLVPLIIPEDREKAALIRDHYSKKIMMLVLRGVALTPYRKKLQEFLNSENDLTEDIIPLVYKLPEFYDYDIGYEEIRVTLTQPDELNPVEKVEVLLTPMKHFNVKKKAGGYDEYWLKDEAGHGYQIKLPNTPVVNPLLCLWDREFAKPSIRIVGKRVTMSPDGFKFYLLEKWTVV